MNLQNRINLLSALGNLLKKNTEEWQAVKHKASIKNGWFTPDFIDVALNNIINEFIDPEKLTAWANRYFLDDNITQKQVGIVMAGNIPLVGFHDFLCVFISGHRQMIKLSSKDDVLLPYLTEKMTELNSDCAKLISYSEMLKGCDAYIATGSNNSARYFEYYFSKYPSIIRRNRTSVAILTGNETMETLEKLADDIHIFFGLGCRNVTKIFVPEEYDFVPLLQSFHRYKYFADHHKYRNNYDYNLAIQIMNNRFYMTNEATLLVESDSIFSPISQLNYSFYSDKTTLLESLKKNDEIQCIAGIDIPFGMAQTPSLTDYADGIDTIQFLLSL
ncbi:acyl-CoA reductase [Ferruginibacter lapsinanis]|uniref:acyl-CoA reductase n=1 Tax=Ferruginibacter lapsinanis TaxID=563172 RepID=UPI001E5929FC|nr:acyl-CoA reductase [Ferruginibacter lapsinanis]UEG48679.1 acyl-CoA reductase [Ferruginibacter lapsinanis]